MRHIFDGNRRDALEILRMDMASRLIPASVLCFVLMCMVLLASHNIALDITLFLAWALFTSAAIGVWLIERQAYRELRARH